MKYRRFGKLSFVGLVLYLNNSCSGTVLNINDFQSNFTDSLDLISEIENNGILIQNHLNLLNVYYLAKWDSLDNEIGVAYFLEWEDEYPDFGRTFEASKINIFFQILTPLFYTNWLYLPNSGGLQRILYGKHDIEGIWVIYSISNGSLKTLDFLTFELPGHNQIQFTKADEQKGTHLVSKNNTPFVKVAAWNHLFDHPNDRGEVQHFIPRPFPVEKWKELKMNNRRAEIAKNFLEQFANK